MKTLIELHQAEASQLLMGTFPEIKDHTKFNLPECSVYKLMLEFTLFTQQAINGHDYRKLKKCFMLANRIYRYGDRTIKNAVRNVYMHGLQFENTNTTARQVKALLPGTLKGLYTQSIFQVFLNCFRLMIALLLLSIAVFGYLFYMLIKPEKF